MTATLTPLFDSNALDPVCFTVAGHAVRWYGVMVALGFLVATVHWSLLGRRMGRKLEYGLDFGFLVMISGMLGGRLGFVIAHAPRFIEHPEKIFRVDEGGLVFYGGFILAILAVAAWSLKRKESVLGALDFGITGVPLGHAFGRVGCFINGCCYGTPTDLPVGIYTAGALRHPMPLYEMAFNLLLYGLLVWRFSRRPPPGRVLALYLTVYPAWRFLTDGLRGDPQGIWHGLSIVQWVSLALIATALALLLLQPRFHHDGPRDIPAGGPAP